jgi:putative peptide maturation system protein
MQRVREQHRDSSIELVWEDQAFDGSLHYDALVRLEEQHATVSMSVSKDDDLPWVLRGLQRWRDSDLLRVNGVTMAVEQAISQLDVLWEKQPLMQKLIDSCIIEGELQRRSIQISGADLQAAFDNLRRRRGLFTVEALQNWLQDSGVSMSALQELAIKLARAAKLREVIAADQVDAYFQTHARQFDQLKIAIVEVRSAQAADALKSRVLVEGMSLAAAAQDAFLTGSAAALNLRKLDRREFAEEFGDLSCEAGTVHVITRDDHLLVVQVLALQPAETSPATHGRVTSALFQQWLADQRRRARIEWFWGDAQRAAQQQAA